MSSGVQSTMGGNNAGQGVCGVGFVVIHRLQQMLGPDWEKEFGPAEEQRPAPTVLSAPAAPVAPVPDSPLDNSGQEEKRDIDAEWEEMMNESGDDGEQSVVSVEDESDVSVEEDDNGDDNSGSEVHSTLPASGTVAEVPNTQQKTDDGDDLDGLFADKSCLFVVFGNSDQASDPQQETGNGGEGAGLGEYRIKMVQPLEDALAAPCSGSDDRSTSPAPVPAAEASNTQQEADHNDNRADLSDVAPETMQEPEDDLFGDNLFGAPDPSPPAARSPKRARDDEGEAEEQQPPPAKRKKATRGHAYGTVYKRPAVPAAIFLPGFAVPAPAAPVITPEAANDKEAPNNQEVTEPPAAANTQVQVTPPPAASPQASRSFEDPAPAPPIPDITQEVPEQQEANIQVQAAPPLAARFPKRARGDNGEAEDQQPPPAKRAKTTEQQGPNSRLLPSPVSLNDSKRAADNKDIMAPVDEVLSQEVLAANLPAQGQPEEENAALRRQLEALRAERQEEQAAVNNTGPSFHSQLSPRPSPSAQPHPAQPFPVPQQHQSGRHQATPAQQPPREIRNFWCPMLMGAQMSLAPKGAQICKPPVAAPLQVHHWCRLANVLRIAERVSVHALTLPIYFNPDDFPLPDPPLMPNGDQPYRAHVEWLEDLLKQWEWQARKLWEANNNMFGAEKLELVGPWMPYDDRSADMRVPAAGPGTLAQRLRLVEVKMQGWARMAGDFHSALSGGQGLLGQQDFGQVAQPTPSYDNGNLMGAGAGSEQLPQQGPGQLPQQTLGQFAQQGMGQWPQDPFQLPPQQGSGQMPQQPWYQLPQDSFGQLPQPGLGTVAPTHPLQRQQKLPGD